MVLEALDLFPKDLNQPLDVIVLNFGYVFIQHLLPHISKLRKAGLRVMVYPTDHKLKKQLQYANQLNTQHVILFGEEEQAKGVIAVKNMKLGSTKEVGLSTANLEVLFL